MLDLEQEYRPLDEEKLRQRDMFGCIGCFGLVIVLGVFFYFALAYAEKWEQEEEEEEVALIKEQERKRIEKNFLERKMATPRNQEDVENEFETEEVIEEDIEEVKPEDLFRGEGQANLHVQNGHVWLEADSDTQFNTCCVILFQMTGIVDASVAEELQEKVSTFYRKTQFLNQRMAEVALLCMIQMKLPIGQKEEEND